MRVVHVISGIDPPNGGPAIALAGLAAAQARAGLEVTVLATYAAGADLSPADRLRDSGVSVELVGPCAGALFRHPHIQPAVEQHLATADVVHVHALWEEVLHQACRAAQRHSIPYLITPHGMLDPWSLAQSKWKKRLYMLWRLGRNLRRAAALHFATEAERDMTAGLNLPTPVIVEPNGLDLSEFENLPPPGAFRSRYPQLGTRPYVVYLGRLHAGKGLELLVPAFAQAQARDAMLVLVGPDSRGFQAQVQGMVAKHGLQDRVVFTGLLRGAERVAALAEATLFALPSFHENFGIAVAEALAAGTPVIISDQVCIHREISAAGVGGVVGLNVEALAHELSRWLSDSPLRQTAAARARAFVWQRYDWNRIAGQWARHYQRLCGA